MIVKTPSVTNRWQARVAAAKTTNINPLTRSASLEDVLRRAEAVPFTMLEFCPFSVSGGID
jgi:hypothetical protein